MKRESLRPNYAQSPSSLRTLLFWGLSIAQLVVACLLFSGSLSWAADAPKSKKPGKLFYYIEPTDFFDGFLGDIGPAPSPTAEGDELGDAFKEFTSVKKATAAIEALKKKNGIKNGYVFAAFEYSAHQNNSGKLFSSCGISSSNDDDWQSIRKAAVIRENMIGGIPFSRFKSSTREERVRAIASCLAKLPGMPPLKPGLALKKLNLQIDEASYALGEIFLKKIDPQGKREQYRKAFECVIEKTARSLPAASGDSVVVRTAVLDKNYNSKESLDKIILVEDQFKHLDFNFQSGPRPDVAYGMYLVVTNASKAEDLWDEELPEGDDFLNFWAQQQGLSGHVALKGVLHDPISFMLGDGLVFVPGCMLSAKLGPNPFANSVQVADAILKGALGPTLKVPLGYEAERFDSVPVR